MYGSGSHWSVPEDTDWEQESEKSIYSGGFFWGIIEVIVR